MKHLADIDHIEQLDTGEMIVGLEGEKVARSREFYAVFQTPPEWEVVFGDKNIGRISPCPDLASGICLLLGGQLWEVIEIYPEQKQVTVKKAIDAHDVLFEGTGIPEMHPKIAQQVYKILCDTEHPLYLSELAVTRLKESRCLFMELGLCHNKIIEREDCWILFPWSGSKVVRTLDYLITNSGFESEFPNMLFPWVMMIKRPTPTMSWNSFINIIQKRANQIQNGYDLLSNIPDQLFRTHKFDQYIPETLIRKRAAVEWIDWEGCKKLLDELD